MTKLGVQFAALYNKLLDSLALHFKDRLRDILSIRVQLYSIILIFSLLLASSLFTTVQSVRDHSRDEGFIDFVLSQRALVRHATWIAQISSGDPELAEVIQSIDQNLTVLKEGGTGVNDAGEIVLIQAETDETIIHQLLMISDTWTSHRARLLEIQALPASDPQRMELSALIQDQSLQIQDQLDGLNRALETRESNEHRRLILIQFTFLLIALPLLAWGGYIIRSQIVRPLSELKEAASRFGQGDLSTPLKIAGPDEIGQLGRTFQDMRSKISNNQAMLENQIAERTYELSVAFEFSQEIVGQLDFENLLAIIPKKASILMRAERVFLCLANPGDNTVEMYADISGVRKGNKPRQQADLVREVAIDGKAVIAVVPDYACNFIQSDSSKQCISVPLRSSDRVIGAICALRDRSDVINENEKQAFTLLANSAAIAIENVRLIDAQEQQARQIAVSLERQRLVSELHDNLIQTLNLVNLRIGQIQGSLVESPGRDFQKEFDLVSSNVTVALEQVRMMMSDIVSPHQDENNLASRVKQDILAFEKKTRLRVDATGIGTFLNRLAPLSQKQLLMILNEALTNVHRHAEAEMVVVLFEENQDKVLMTIEDNGRGFQTDLDHGSLHYGLRIMRTRAERSGGSLSVESEPGQGTRIRASFPFAVQE